MTTSMAFRSFKVRFIFIFIYAILYFITIYFIIDNPIKESDIFNNLKISKEKFLTYLLHGGFNNQRIALENAIFLAWFLNRTLIIPPILLFEGFTPAKYRSYDELYNFLSQHIRPDKNQFKYCFQEDQKNCTMMTYTMYNWEELLDFTFLKHHIKNIHRQDFDYKHLLVSLNIYDSTEVYVTGNDYKYQQRYYYDYINNRTRIVRQLLESTEFWNKLMKEMLPNNPTLIYIVDKIINKIGGINSFIGVHARLKGGSFDKNQNDIIQELIKRIKEDFEDGVCLTTKIFLATDLNRNHIFLKPFFQTFSCIYVLNDFNDLLEPLEFLKILAMV
ncbi:ciga protein [Gigaspora margarita]|uniref:Ciga protein n=1 Tax=Gigaspora margarita TaxID=4874 RepID=A0A8H4EUY1_GIGMA|nr:ciga protein [Gigaspora margarita]